MTIVSNACTAPASVQAAFVALSAILGLTAAVTLTDGDAVALTVVTKHPLTGTQRTQTYQGPAATIQAMCAQVPTAAMWSEDAAVWIDDCVAAMTDSSAMETFLRQLESTLSTQPYLLEGDIPSAADVLVARCLSKVDTTAAPATTTFIKNIHALAAIQDDDAAAAAVTTTSEQLGTMSIHNQSTTSTTTTTTDNIVLSTLAGIPHHLYSHVLCKTAEELVANVPIPDTDSHTKNLLFKDKKHGLFLFVLATKSHLDTKTLGTLLGLEGKVNMRLADEPTLDAVLGVKPGCVGPLCVVNDVQQQVTVILDQALMNVDHIHSHPLRNDMSVSMKPNDLKDYILNKTAHQVTLLEFGVVSAAPTETPAGGSKAKPPPAKAVAKKPDPNKKVTKKGETLLALQWKKSENFSMWYSDVIVLSEMISYYDISGCYILRPWSYKIWELITEWFNGQIKPLGVENSYFPMFVSKDRLEKEKDHVEGFSPEVAWVTKSGDSDLAFPIAVRPTSETIMYPAFSDWIKSHRDLPLKLNQWSNVVRWEFKDPTPFLRTREFLWQEGHTAHANYEDSNVMVMQALELYRRVYEELLAVPVIKGYKTEKEKFAGGYQTTTVEAYVPMSGRAIQGATSHNLGQNFGKMFDIRFQDHEGNTQIPWQTSWGLTTRTIGVMVMVHGDDIGLVLPPMLSPLQAVIVPILSKNLTPEQADPTCEAILKQLLDAGIRAKYDEREMYNPGWKYNHWEQKGVPLRIEVGPRDIEQQSVRVVVRFNGEKIDLPIEGLATALRTKLVDIQAAMFAKAKEARDSHLVHVMQWKDFVPNLELNNLVLTPWCGGECKEEEEEVKEKSKEESLKISGAEGEAATEALSVSAKTLCIPFDQPELPEGTKCFYTGKPAKCWVLWGRSY